MATRSTRFISGTDGSPNAQILRLRPSSARRFSYASRAACNPPRPANGSMSTPNRSSRRCRPPRRISAKPVHAIGASLAAGLGCAIGTKLFMYEHIESGLLHYRPIVEPELSRTLYVCEMADRPATYALEAVRRLILDLVRHSVMDGRWEARMVMP